jgi:predicted PurR-regulated permease PerM
MSETHQSQPAQQPQHTQHPERKWRAPAWRNTDVLRTAALVIAMYMLVRLVWFAHPLLLTAFLGVLFGLAVASGADRLTPFGIPRGVAAGLIVAAFFGLLVGFGAWVAPTLRGQGIELRQRLPEALDRLELWVDRHRGGIIGLLLGGFATEAKTDSAAASQPSQAPIATPTAAPTTPPAIAPPPSRDSMPAHVTATGDTARTPVHLRDRIGQQFSGATKYLFPFLSSTLAAFTGLLVVIFLSIYIAADPELYRQGIMHLFPHGARERAGEVLSATAAVLRKWLVTQLIAMATIGAITTIVLLVLRVKAAFALGVLAGLLEFIPTIGPILSALPAVAMGFLDSPEKALYVIIAYTGIQFLENHLLIPLLMKGGVDLPPALTIMSQALMALLFGFLGLMCAVPLLAAVMVSVKMLYVEDVVGDPAFAPDENPAEGVEG